MIFVTVGSSSIAFDRLLQAVDQLGIDERLVVQCGASTIRPHGAECVEFLDFDGFVDLIRDARVMVTHAGVGSVMTALRERKRPVVVPRLAVFGEAVDDHQVSFAQRAAELGLVTLIEEVNLLDRAIREQEARTLVLNPGSSSPIELELRNFIRECIGPPTPVAARAKTSA
jgi:beta-1,4-N-acetylglucosaminyltransferase